MPWQTEITNHLEKYTGYEVECTGHSIRVICQNPGAFAVAINDHGSEFQVDLGGWHEHFDTLEEARNCFAFGLSDQCRLKVTLRGRMECKWTVQSYDDDCWVDDTETGLIFIPFWRPKRVEYRRNVLVPK